MSGKYIAPNGDVFEAHCELMDVTSMHRPDTSWRFVDAQGHEHRWHVESSEPNVTTAPAVSYNPSAKYITPTLIWVKDGEEFWEDDDEPHEVGHLECKQCGQHVSPHHIADSTVQYIPGLRHYRINGVTVSEEEFKTKLPKT